MDPQAGETYLLGFLDGLADAQCAAALLDGSGRSLFINELARALLGSTLTMREGFLLPLEDEARPGWEAAVAGAAAGHEGMTPGWTRLSDSSEAQPVWGLVRRWTSRHDGRVRLLAIFERAPPPDGSAHLVLARRYRLTSSEARVAALIAEGRTIREISHALGNSTETVRSHLKAVFMKVGVHRQSDIVRLVAHAAAIHHHPAAGRHNSPPLAASRRP